LVTSLTQYTALITNEYLQKFDDPYRYSDGTLYVHQVPWSLDQLPAICEAIQDASGVSHHHQTPLPSPTVLRKKRKALDNITGSSNQAQRVQKERKGEVRWIGLGDNRLSEAEDLLDVSLWIKPV